MLAVEQLLRLSQQLVGEEGEMEGERLLLRRRRKKRRRKRRRRSLMRTWDSVRSSHVM